MTVIREDDTGIYVIPGGYAARPGNHPGYGHTLKMDDHGLKKGDKVKARHVSGTQYTKIVTEDHTELYWMHDNSYDPVKGWPCGRKL